MALGRPREQFRQELMVSTSALPRCPGRPCCAALDKLLAEAALRGLTAGRGGVPESAPVQPVPWSMVEPALPHLFPPLRAAVLLQWYAGLRPTETLQITRPDQDAPGHEDLPSDEAQGRLARTRTRCVARTEGATG
jgi:hypothetical protein